eukprot:TRINITY_DN8955_c0_g1_i1.p1 TRINITY_DN8955_c0_g1~~TRINITY_DN8955_c0_g1_i1.p1  ORF type:complete len:118 (+),score=14.16 TRINITY_DN8955_c0_g1_i1:93-446(+)
MAKNALNSTSACAVVVAIVAALCAQHFLNENTKTQKFKYNDTIQETYKHLAEVKRQSWDDVLPENPTNEQVVDYIVKNRYPIVLTNHPALKWKAFKKWNGKYFSQKVPRFFNKFTEV